MVEKKVTKIDPKYYTVKAIEKKFKPLFSSAKTRKSKDLNTASDCKKISTKKESRKLNIDAPQEEY